MNFFAGILLLTVVGSANAESDDEIRWREKEHNLNSVDMMSISGRSLYDFGIMATNVLEVFCSSITYTLTNYGCFCGSNYLNWPPKSNVTMDDFDAICLDHDWCYQEAEDLDWWCSGYFTSYNFYIGENNVAYCGNRAGDNSNDKCEEFVCQCDVKFTNSMRQLIENPNGANNCPNTNPGCQNP